MSKDVLITIKSKQNLGGGESDGTELVTRGTYDFSADAIRFSYMESELTGLDGTKTVFLITPDEVVLSRRGTVNSQMVFHRGEHCDFLYNTEYGMLTLGLDTRSIVHTLDEHGGDMEIEYDLDFEKSFVSRNKFEINVRERKLKS